MLAALKRRVKPLVLDAGRRMGVATTAEDAAGSLHHPGFPARSVTYGEGRPIGAQLFAPRRVEIPALGVRTFARGEIVGDQGLARDADGRWILDYGLPSARLAAVSGGSAAHLEGLTASLCNPVVGRNYYHFVLDCLPRIRLCREAGLEPDQLYAPADEPYQREAFALLGLSSRVVAARPGSTLACERLAIPDDPVRTDPLVTPDFTWAQARYQLDWALEFLDSELRAAHAAKVAAARRASHPRRIYLSRDRARNRKVLNESELVDALGALGVTRVFTEGMTLLEQMALFGQAELVVGPHGAGLTNLVFAPRGCLVVELVPDLAPLSFFQMLAETRGLDYHHLAAESVFNGDRRRYPAYDCRVDVKRLATFLEERLGAATAAANR